MNAPFRVVVLGEGKDELGKRPRSRPPFSRVPHDEQGAMEILVRRALYPILNGGNPWHRGLAAEDGIEILQAPLPRLPSTVEILSDPVLLAPMILASLRPPRPPAPADLLIASHDSDAGLASVVDAIDRVNKALNAAVPVLAPVPEIQAWLTRKRSIELAYDREHCTVGEPDEGRLRKDAKAELRALLSSFGGKFDARMQAKLAFWISDEDLHRFEWTAWSTVDGKLRDALQRESLMRREQATALATL